MAVDFSVANYQKALEILNQCNAYVKQELGSYYNNPYYESQTKLMFIEEFPNGSKAYLVSGDAYGGMSIRLEIRHDYWQDKDIRYKDSSELPCYNRDEQSTINLAVKVVSGWERIKDKIEWIKSCCDAKVADETEVLNNFTL